MSSLDQHRSPVNQTEHSSAFRDMTGQVDTHKTEQVDTHMTGQVDTHMTGQVDTHMTG